MGRKLIDVGEIRMWCLLFVLLLAHAGCRESTQPTRQHLKHPFPQIPELSTAFFTVPVPNGWSAEVKHGNTVYLKRVSSFHVVMIVIWRVPVNETPEDVVRWMRSGALELSPDGKFRDASLEVGGRKLTGIKFTVKSDEQNKKRGINFFEVIQVERKSSRTVIGITVFFPNGKSVPEVERVILKHFKPNEEIFIKADKPLWEALWATLLHCVGKEWMYAFLVCTVGC